MLVDFVGFFFFIMSMTPLTSPSLPPASSAGLKEVHLILAICLCICICQLLGKLSQITIGMLMNYIYNGIL